MHSIVLRKRGKKTLSSPALAAQEMKRVKLPAVPNTGHVAVAVGRRPVAFRDPENTEVGVLAFASSIKFLLSHLQRFSDLPHSGLSQRLVGHLL
jgi:hypothetical protein